MKRIILLLMIASTSISVVQAQIYKCPDKVQGRFTYQERPCKGFRVNEHTLVIIPADEKKIAKAQAKLAEDLNPDKDAKENKELTGTNKPAATNATVNPAEKVPAANDIKAATTTNTKGVAPAPETKNTTPVIIQPPKPDATKPVPVPAPVTPPPPPANPAIQPKSGS